MVRLHSPFLHPAATRLASRLVAEQFGETCKEVTRALMEHGPQSLHDLRRSSGLATPHLKVALLVLIQHNYVACWLHRDPPNLRGEYRVEQLYEALPVAVLASLHAPRLLIHIKDRMGDAAEAVAIRLLQNGRLRLDQLVAAMESEKYQAEDSRMENGTGSSTATSSTAEEAQAALVQLIRARLVERCPPSDLPPPRQELHPAARKRKASVRPGSEEEADLQRERAHSAVHAAYDAARFRIPDDMVPSIKTSWAPSEVHLAEDGTGAVSGKKRVPDGVPAGVTPPPTKRGRRKVVKADAGLPTAASAASLSSATTPAPSSTPQQENGTGASPSEQVNGTDEPTSKDVLWRLNFAEYYLRIRDQAIADYFSDRYGRDTGMVIHAVLDASSARQSDDAPSTTLPMLGEAEIVRSLQSRFPESGVLGKARALMEACASDWDSTLTVTSAGEGGSFACTLDIPAALRALRHRHVEAGLRERFGPEGVRIWRALRAQGLLEQKQVADFCMLNSREAKQILNRMLHGGFLTLQDVPRTADRAPSRTFYLWKADPEGAMTAVTIELLLATGNVHSRLAHELAERTELLTVLDMVNAGLAGPGVLTERAADFSRIKRVTTLLEASLLHLADSLALFA